MWEVCVFCFFFLLILGVGLSFKASHPLILGCGLLGLLVSICFCLLEYSSLLSFPLFVVMIGGVLVVFCFVIALIPYMKSKKEKVDSVQSWVLMKKSPLSWFEILIGLALCGVLSLTSVHVSRVLSCDFFSDSLYFSTDWGLISVALGCFLFVIMVFGVSVAIKNKNSGSMKK